MFRTIHFFDASASVHYEEYRGFGLKNIPLCIDYWFDPKVSFSFYTEWMNKTVSLMKIWRYIGLPVLFTTCVFVILSEIENTALWLAKSLPS